MDPRQGDDRCAKGGTWWTRLCSWAMTGSAGQTRSRREKKDRANCGAAVKQGSQLMQKSRVGNRFGEYRCLPHSAFFHEWMGIFPVRGTAPRLGFSPHMEGRHLGPFPQSMEEPSPASRSINPPTPP